MMKNVVKSNKGFSIVELLVVVSVMAIMVGFSALSITIVNNMNVSKAARELNSAINTARSTAISKGTDAGTLYIYNTGDGVFYSIGVDDLSLSSKVCAKAVNCTVVNYTGAGSYEQTAAYSASALGTKTIVRFAPSGVVIDETDKPCQFVFNRNNKTVAVVLYRQTGKHEVKLY